MKNALIVILAVILVFAISGCSSSKEEAATPSSPSDASVSVTVTKEPTNLKAAFDVINEGQTKSDILGMLGEPLEKQQVSGKNLEYWYYESGPDVLQVAFDSGTVSAKRMY
ncbi:MAG: hypothetical protein V1839_00850 [archaeon]